MTCSTRPKPAKTTNIREKRLDDYAKKVAKQAGEPVKATRRIRCSFPRKVEVRMATFPERQELVVALGHTARAVLHTDFRPRSSLTYYDTRYCTDAPVPGVR